MESLESWVARINIVTILRKAIYSFYVSIIKISLVLTKIENFEKFER